MKNEIWIVKWSGKLAFCQPCEAPKKKAKAGPVYASSSLSQCDAEYVNAWRAKAGSQITIYGTGGALGCEVADRHEVEMVAGPFVDFASAAIARTALMS